MLSAKTEKKLTVVFFCLTCQFNLLNLGASKERVFFCDPKKFTSSIKTPGGSIFCRATTAISFQIDPVYQNSQQKKILVIAIVQLPCSYEGVGVAKLSLLKDKHQLAVFGATTRQGRAREDCNGSQLQQQAIQKRQGTRAGAP